VAIDTAKSIVPEGTLAEMLRPEDILERVRERAENKDISNALITGGTFPTLTGDLNYSPEFAFELSDPVTGEKISHRYKIRTTNWFLKK
jgi:hypothetical protein